MLHALKRLLPHWMLHDWRHLETFAVEGRDMERQRCASCAKTRITRDI
jgi:hypothetical protein